MIWLGWFNYRHPLWMPLMAILSGMAVFWWPVLFIKSTKLLVQTMTFTFIGSMVWMLIFLLTANVASWRSRNWRVAVHEAEKMLKSQTDENRIKFLSDCINLILIVGSTREHTTKLLARAIGIFEEQDRISLEINDLEKNRIEGLKRRYSDLQSNWSELESKLFHLKYLTTA
jgi:hypothetical protein